MTLILTYPGCSASVGVTPLEFRRDLCMASLGYSTALLFLLSWKILWKQEAQLSQRNRATRFISWNLVKCYTNIRKISVENAWVTLKVAQGHLNCRDSMYYLSFIPAVTISLSSTVFDILYRTCIVRRRTSMFIVLVGDLH